MLSKCCRSELIPNINLPENCPKCGNKLERDGAYLICPFIECSGAVFGNMMTWINTQGIMLLGRTTVANLIELGVDSPDKLYTASDEILTQSCGSPITAQKIQGSISQTKKIKLSKFLTGLNIQHLGNTNGERIAEKFKTLDGVLKASLEEIGSIEGIKTTSQKLYDGLQQKKGLIDNLRKNVEVSGWADGMIGPLAGKNMCMTGLRQWKGKDLAGLITANGGIVKSSVGKKLDYLIIKESDSTSTKAEKAKELGIKMISPDEFFEMIGMEE